MKWTIWRRISRWLERILFLAAMLAFGRVYADVLALEYNQMTARLALYEARRVHDAQTRDVASKPTESPPAVVFAEPEAELLAPSTMGVVPASPTARAPQQLVGELTIPRLNLTTLVVDTADPAGLRLAAGHLRGTPLPWQHGNAAVAAHRDSAFRKLADARRGDEVHLVTPHGTFDYVVTRAFAVYPHDVWVLDEKAAALTLITCFPFRWVGTAPERWIVQADRLPS